MLRFRQFIPDLITDPSDPNPPCRSQARKWTEAIRKRLTECTPCLMQLRADGPNVGPRPPAANRPRRKGGKSRRFSDPVPRTSSSFAENGGPIFRMLCGEKPCICGE
ncbi:MAG: hypothetical protein F4213_13550 [Boseongicola sp. SB0677_bin_26]|nr:hypothetical protein [Boseongicola sp. SB0665_bin_10]MYG27027.1 hypothetical protein [Boseongicola sp. SB0677_bin_26]